MISGGAIAASTSTFIPGATLSMGNAGSFIVTTNTVVNTKAPEDILLESIFPEGQTITPEMIAQAESQITTMRQDHQQQIKDYETNIAALAPAQQKQANKELDSFKGVFEKYRAVRSRCCLCKRRYRRQQEQTSMQRQKMLLQPRSITKRWGSSPLKKPTHCLLGVINQR